MRILIVVRIYNDVNKCDRELHRAFMIFAFQRRAAITEPRPENRCIRFESHSNQTTRLQAFFPSHECDCLCLFNYFFGIIV